MRDKRQQVDSRTFYRVFSLDGRGFKCEVDECEFDAVVEVESRHSVGGTIAACYMCITFAVEDLLWEMSDKGKRDRLATIEVCKKRIGEDLKNGFEYD